MNKVGKFEALISNRSPLSQYIKPVISKLADGGITLQ